MSRRNVLLLAIVTVTLFLGGCKFSAEFDFTDWNASVSIQNCTNNEMRFSVKDIAGQPATIAVGEGKAYDLMLDPTNDDAASPCQPSRIIIGSDFNGGTPLATSTIIRTSEVAAQIAVVPVNDTCIGLSYDPTALTIAIELNGNWMGRYVEVSPGCIWIVAWRSRHAPGERPFAAIGVIGKQAGTTPLTFHSITATKPDESTYHVTPEEPFTVYIAVTEGNIVQVK